MINALNKPSDEKNYADAAAQFAYRAYGFSGDQYNYIVSSIDKQFMEIIKMEMMYQEFIAQRGDYFEEKYPDDESKWESYAAWTNDLNKLNEDVAKAMDTMLDREILVSDSTVGSIRMKLDEFVKPEDMVSVRMKNENYHEKLTGEFYENEQPIIDAFNEGYLYLIEEYGWKSNADVITPFINFHRIAVPTPKTEENPSGIDIYYIFDTSQPHDAEEDWAWNSDDSVPENLRFYQFEEKIDLTLARDQHIPSCDFINLTKENYSDGQNQFSCAKSTAEFQSLFATGLFSALSSIPGDYLSEYLLTKKDTKTYIALSDYDFDYHDAWATSYTIFHVVDTTGQYPGSSLESSTLSAEKIQPDKSAGAYSAYTVILKNRPQEDGYYKTKVDVATNGVGDTELEMVQEDGTICQENIVPSGKEVTLRFKAEGTTVLESITLQRHNNTENPSEVTSEETLLTKDQIATLSPDEEGYYTYTYSAPYSNATFVLNGAVGHMFYTTVPGFIVSCVVYFIAGAHFASDSQVGQVDEIINTLGELFNLAMPVGLLLLIPCVIVIAGSLMKKPTIPVMIISSAVAIVLAMLVQGFSFTDCAASMVSGFKMEMLHTSMDLENIVEQVPNLLQRGGMSSMMNTALMAFCGFSFIGALTVCGSMELILERIMKHIHGTGQLITLTVILGVIMITVIGEATVTFLMIGGMFRPEYIKRGLESKNLSRSLEDSITVVEPLVPWSLAGVYMTSVLGVPTVQYAPWAVLCYTGVIFAIIWGFTGFGIAKIKKGSAAYEEYLELSGKTE